MTSCATYTCRQPLAICYLLPAICFLLPALRIKLSASCFMHSASSSPLMHRALRFLLYALGFQLSTHASSSPLLASCFRLPASCALCLYSLLSAPSALSHLLPASCFLRTLPLPFTLYSLLTASALSALCPQLSAFRSLPFNIGTLRKMVFREVVSMGSEPQLFHTSKKRVRSATSRRTPTLSVCYQLAFFTPGIRPFEAISRNWIRLMPN